MARKISVLVDKPFMGHNGQVREVIVREPTFEEYLKFGDPVVWVPLPEGGMFPTENTEVINAYVKICIVDPDYLICLAGGMDLARKLKGAILDFFLPASDKMDKTGAGSQTSPTT